MKRGKELIKALLIILCVLISISITACSYNSNSKVQNTVNERKAPCQITELFGEKMKRIYSKVVILLFLFGLLSACSNSTSNNNNTVSGVTSDTVVDSFTYNYYSINDSKEFILIDGILYGRGNNYNGLFGPNSNIFCDTYVKIAENVIHFEATDGAILYLTEDFKVYGFGNSENLELLADDSRAEMIITPKLLFEDCKYFSLGTNCVLAIKNDNSLWFWGSSLAGQGCKISETALKPYKIADKFKFAKSFLHNSAWIDDKDSLYIVGTNAFNQIGNGKNGRGIKFLYDDVVFEPYLALENCKSFSVSENFVIHAVTNDGIEYIWGKNHKPVPTKIKDEFPEKATGIKLSNSKVIINDEYGALKFENSPLYFYYEDNNIYKKYGDENYGKIVKSNISNPFLSSIGDGLLAVSCADDDCVYLISYAINEKGEMINIKNSLLLDTYAVPIYIKDSKHIAFVKPNSQKELLLNVETGKAEDGEFLNYSNLDNKPTITEREARKIALNELSKSKYKEFAQNEHSFSAVEVSSLEYRPQYQGDYLNSWVTKDYFNNNFSWIWTVKVGCDKNDLCDMMVYVNASDGNVLYIANSSDYYDDYQKRLNKNEYSLCLSGCFPTSLIVNETQNEYVNMSQAKNYSDVENLYYMCYNKTSLNNVNNISQKIINHFLEN